MPEKVKEILTRIKDWWGKFTNKQKTIIAAIVSVIIFTIVIIVYVSTRPQYIVLGSYETAADAAEIIKILEDAGVEHKESADARTIEVETKDEAAANYAIGAAGYTPARLKYSDFVSSGMSATTTDKQNQYKLFMEAQLERSFKMINSVKDVKIFLGIPEQNGTLLAQREESSAYIQLELDGLFTSAQAAAMARAAQSFLGNDTTANITIVDQDSNILFAGGDDYSTAGIANSMQELQLQAESMIANQVKKVLYGTKQYNSIEVTSHLSIDFSTYEETVKKYWPNDDRTEGMKSEEDRYTSETSNGISGIPGTDSNDGSNLTTYVNPDYNNSQSTTEEIHTSYLPNESANYKTTPAGAIDYNASSMSIAMISYREYYEENVRNQGLLDGGITWKEFKANNSADIRREVDEELYQLAANATGISKDKISIIAYESPVFFDKEGMSISTTDVLSIVLIVVIFALLIFVILRSMATNKQEEEAEQEELSVESILQSNPESAIEDIDLETKSETRKMIEKFVDENPEAAAILLRNWLNEDWA